MTSKSDVVKAWTDLPSDDVAASAAYLSDDFLNVDKDGNVVMNKEAWVGMNHMLLASFKDWQWVLAELREEGDSVIMTGHFEGTFTADLDLSAMGIGVVPASGKAIKWSPGSSQITVEGDRISRMEPYGEGGGFEDFVAVLKD